MAGLQWSDTQSGYLDNPTLSEEFRTALQPLSRFRQFCDVQAAIGKHRGQEFQWNVYGDTSSTNADGTITENASMPEGDFAISQGTVTIKERGHSVPYTGKLEALSEHDIEKIVFKVLKNHCNRTMDYAAHADGFDSGILQYVATGATAYTLTEAAAAVGTNNSDLSTTHVKQISDLMQERNIPTMDGGDYICVARPSTIRAVKDDLEATFMYTQEGYSRVVNGENGRYEGVRFVSQTNIAAETTWTSNSKSDAAFFFGSDSVVEAIAVPEELRAKIGEDYGRSKGIAWYALNAFACIHSDTTSTETKAQARILKWASAA